MSRAMLSYDKGTISIQGVAHIPSSNLDPHTNMLRAVALYSKNFLDYLANVNFSD
ncbi:MAG: hypothetical protein WA220_01440 [Candidatus Nitrosopolaris sp.]|jgi:hypothetical protein